MSRSSFNAKPLGQRLELRGSRTRPARVTCFNAGPFFQEVEPFHAQSSERYGKLQRSPLRSGWNHIESTVRRVRKLASTRVPAFGDENDALIAVSKLDVRSSTRVPSFRGGNEHLQLALRLGQLQLRSLRSGTETSDHASDSITLDH
jgi:hypothetical protein